VAPNYFGYPTTCRPAGSIQKIFVPTSGPRNDLHVIPRLYYPVHWHVDTTSCMFMLFAISAAALDYFAPLVGYNTACRCIVYLYVIDYMFLPMFEFGCLRLLAKSLQHKYVGMGNFSTWPPRCVDFIRAPNQHMAHRHLLGATTTRIRELRSRKAQLLQEVDEVEQELGEVQVRHDGLVNQCAAVSKLPPELLASIFMKCQEMWLTTSSKHPFEVISCRVSSHWRRVALGTPLLWNNIHLHITLRNNGTHHAERLAAYLVRSGSCLLDISLRITVPQNIPQFLSLLVAHADRWRRVSVSLAHCRVDDVCTPLCDVRALALVHLSLRVGNPKDDPHSPRTEYPSVSPPILRGGSPLLSFVRVAGMVVGNLEPPLSTVTTLHIDAWPRNLMSHSRFQEMLEALPCLVNLSLTGLNIYLPRDPLHVSSPTPVPTLRSLRIRGYFTPCHRFLSLISIPHLESLSLHSVDTFDSAPIPTLRSLTLESCALNESEIGNLLRAFPEVSTFCADHSVLRNFLFHMASEGVWPCLEDISLRELPSDDATSFCLMSLSRSGESGRLRRVRVDKRSRKVLRGKGYLEVLRNAVLVEYCEDIESWPPGLDYEDPDDDWDY
jgi:hypothetical protein